MSSDVFPKPNPGWLFMKKSNLIFFHFIFDRNWETN